MSARECSREVRDSLSSGDYSRVHDFYQRTFSSPVEMNALLKLDPEEQGRRIEDSGVSLSLLHAIYDHLEDLVSLAAAADEQTGRQQEPGMRESLVTAALSFS